MYQFLIHTLTFYNANTIIEIGLVVPELQAFGETNRLTQSPLTHSIAENYIQTRCVVQII